MLRLNSLSASGMRYGRLRTKRLACSRASQPLEMALCAASCAVVAMSAIIVVFPFVWGFVCESHDSWCVGWCNVWGGLLQFCYVSPGCGCCGRWRSFFFLVLPVRVSWVVLFRWHSWHRTRRFCGLWVPPWLIGVMWSTSWPGLPQCWQVWLSRVRICWRRWCGVPGWFGFLLLMVV